MRRKARRESLRGGGGGKVVSDFRPFAEFNQASFAPGEPDSPLVARNGTYVRYETRFNGIAFDGFAHATGVLRAPEGAIAVKAAWRLLTKADPPGRARALLCRRARLDHRCRGEPRGGRVVCGRADLALVGLHFVVRTPN